MPRKPQPPKKKIDLQTAVDNYGRAMTHCDNLIALHRSSGKGGAGRRIREVSLDRAVIVLAVAAWQAAVQDMTSAVLDMCEPTGVPQAEVARYRAITGPVKKAIQDFATPNGENTRKLMVSAGFDPAPHWVYVTIGGYERKRIEWKTHEVQQLLNEWLKVRHAIAHGHEKMPLVSVLQAVRTDKLDDPNVRLIDATQCMKFMDRLVRLTARAVADHLGETVNTSR